MRERIRNRGRASAFASGAVGGRSVGLVNVGINPLDQRGVGTRQRSWAIGSGAFQPSVAGGARELGLGDSKSRADNVVDDIAAVTGSVFVIRGVASAGSHHYGAQWRRSGAENFNVCRNVRHIGAGEGDVIAGRPAIREPYKRLKFQWLCPG